MSGATLHRGPPCIEAMTEHVTSSHSGMILGRFMPPHQGHQYIIDFARHFVDQVILLVWSTDDDPISGETRCAWVQEMCPQARVISLRTNFPQDGRDEPEHWQRWQEAIRRVLPEGPEYVFSSDSDGQKFAEILDAQFIPVDPARSLVPISGVLIRENPMATWEYLPTCVRSYFVRRVCVFGLEATGRTTLARRLAAYYGTTCVSEYASSYLAGQEREYRPADIEIIARGQIASENALVRQANRLLFSDTDLITTMLHCENLFGQCPQWIHEAVEHQRYDLYLLTDIDVPWKHAQQQQMEARENLFKRCIEALESRGRQYVRISGSWKQRFQKACQEVDRLLET